MVAPEIIWCSTWAGFCSKYTIFTSQQTTFVQRPVLLIFEEKTSQHLYNASSC